MRHAIIIGVAAILSASVYAAVRIPAEVSSKGALANVRIRVVDQDGRAVADAKVWGGFTCGNLMNDYVLVDGMTDTNGMYVAKGKCNEFLRFDVRKEGYYHTEEKIYFGRSKADPIVVDGKWQPYGETRTVVLKRIRKPTPMSHIPRGILKIPAQGVWIGFDLELQSFVFPYGEGRMSDVLLRSNTDVVDVQTNFLTTLEVSFTNNLHAGFYLCKKDSFSEMKSEYAADTNANFMAHCKYSLQRLGRFRSEESLTDDSYMVFRTRTRVDEKGNLISANYGKIYGRWGFYRGMGTSGIWFNSEPNDTNLEDAETARKSRLGYEKSLEFEKKRQQGGK